MSSPTGLYPFGQFSESQLRGMAETRFGVRLSNCFCPIIDAETQSVRFAASQTPNVISGTLGTNLIYTTGALVIDPAQNQATLLGSAPAGHTAYTIFTRAMVAGTWRIIIAAAGISVINASSGDVGDASSFSFYSGAAGAPWPVTVGTPHEAIFLPQDAAPANFWVNNPSTGAAGIFTTVSSAVAPVNTTALYVYSPCYFAIQVSFFYHYSIPAIVGGTRQNGSLTSFSLAADRQ